MITALLRLSPVETTEVKNVIGGTGGPVALVHVAGPSSFTASMFVTDKEKVFLYFENTKYYQKVFSIQIQNTYFNMYFRYKIQITKVSKIRNLNTSIFDTAQLRNVDFTTDIQAHIVEVNPIVL